MEVDLKKLKKIITQIITHPLNKENSLEWQIGDLLLDIERLKKENKKENIYIFKTGAESEQWRIDFRKSKDGTNELPFMIITPDEWIKDTRIEKN